MRSGFLARVVLVSLGVSVVITLGCGKSPTEPSSSPPASFSVLSISPQQGSTIHATTAQIYGTGFQSGDTVTVDGSRVNATVLDATSISVSMPPQTAGTVAVTVSRARLTGAASLSVPGGFRYTVIPPPVLNEFVPSTASTAGGAVFIKIATGYIATVTVDGISTDFDYGDPPDFGIYLTMPAHAAGTVEVVVTDLWGQAGSGVFTYVSAARKQ